ncbi:MAG: hypothetical protein ABIT83_19945 [Massilia sp.]
MKFSRKAAASMPVLSLVTLQPQTGEAAPSALVAGYSVGRKALTTQSVALIVKAFVRIDAGNDAAKNVAQHLRAGYCTETATVGLQPYQIFDQTGPRFDITLAR